MKNALTLIFLLTLSVIFCDAKNEVSFLDSLDTGYELIDSDLSRAQKLGEFCEKYSFEQNDSLKWAKSLNLLTIIYKRQAKFSESIKVGIQSFEIYKKIGSKQGELNTLNSVALTYCNTGEYSKAIRLFDRAEVLIESDSSISGRAKIYTNKGKTLLEVGLLSEAKFSLKKAIEIDEKAKKVFGLTYSYCQLASLYKKEGHLDTSKTYVLKSLKCAQKTSNKLMEGVAYKMLGEIYETNGNIKKAISWVEKSCAIQVELGDQIEIMRTNASLGDLYFKLGDYKKSEQFTKIAYKGAMKSGFKEGQANSALTLSKLNERKGAYEDALVYYREANDIFEKIGGGKVAKEIAVLEYQHSLEQSELEKQNVQVAMALQEESHKSQVLLFLLIILVGLGLALATYVGFKTYKQKAEDKEVYLNKMLSTKALQVVSNANLFNNVNDIIKKGSESFPEVHKDQLRSVQADIKTAIDSNAWKEFELAFNGVNKGFYKNLEKDFPNLTKNERKLCAFLRMDLSTKDISNITFQSKHSIDIARSRLRKKLGLSNNQTSLYSFLRSY